MSCRSTKFFLPFENKKCEIGLHVSMTITAMLRVALLIYIVLSDNVNNESHEFTHLNSSYLPYYVIDD